MLDFKWSATEKRVARAAFDRAVSEELAEIVADFKQRAVAVTEPGEMWELSNSLNQTRRDFDDKYDYRYSQLIFVFARLIREGRINSEDLKGLSADKMEAINRIFEI